MCNTTATRRPKLHVFYFGTAANLNANRRWNRKNKNKNKNDRQRRRRRKLSTTKRAVRLFAMSSTCSGPFAQVPQPLLLLFCHNARLICYSCFVFFFALLSIGHNMRAFIAPFITIERTELRNTCDGPSSHIIFFFVFVAANSSNLELRILRLPPMILPTWQFEADLLLIYFLCVTIFVWQLFGRNVTDDGTSNSQSSHCVVPWILLALYYFAVILLCSWHFEFWQ